MTNKKTTTEKINTLLNYLVELQSSTAPIELSIGYVSEDSQVQHNCIVIKKCPPHIFDVVASWKEVHKEMIREGMLITADW